MVRTVSPEMAAKAAATVKATQSRVRGTTPKVAAKPASKVKREALPAGQQRSRGRVILSSGDRPCTFEAAAGTTCGNPGRWPVARHPKLAKLQGVTATTLTCTTHLRTLLVRANLLDQKAAVEQVLISAPASRPARKPKAAPAPVVEAAA